MTSASLCSAFSSTTAELVPVVMVTAPSIRVGSAGKVTDRLMSLPRLPPLQCEEAHMDHRLDTPWIALRLGIGLTATLAGIDKFFNLLADWASYVSPAAARFLPVSTATFMGIVGVVELAVGVAILTGWSRAGAYVASAWLLGVATN